MAIRKIEKGDWSAYFDRFSRQFRSKKRVDYAEIRVFSPEIGALRETTWLPLIGITYDRKDELLNIAVQNMNHFIYHPEEIYVDEANEGVINSMEVVRRDGTKEVIEVR